MIMSGGDGASVIVTLIADESKDSIFQEEDDVDFSGLSHLAKSVNFKQECLDECYKRFVKATKRKQ